MVAMDDIIIRDYVASDVSSMATMIPRAYAPDAFLQQIIPDTPATRRWWELTYSAALSNAAARILVAVDGTTGQTVGILTMDYYGPNTTPGANSRITSVVPLTPDHSPVWTEAHVKLKQSRQKLMGSEPHYAIELVGIDDNYKSRGIGKVLAQRACDIADEKDAAIFLQTTAARNWYVDKLNLDFQTVKAKEGDMVGGTVIRARRSMRQILNKS